ncbi:MAG: hypothetical protein EHM12_00280 [Dehalococcoidia bacterium]|nr:MAG: hypothetical protein EHM12_00280 [Dehalococcoidia bacterium]
MSSPTITVFDIKPGIIQAGDRAELTWSVTGASSVNIDNGIGEVALNGSRTVFPTATTIYKITAVNSFGSNFATAQVITEGVNVSAASGPVINSFAVSQAVVLAQSPVVLSWNISNASSASIDQGIGMINPVSGTVTVTPAVSTTYILTAVNGSGNAISKVAVTIAGTSSGSGLPVINSFQADSSTIPSGTSVMLTWNVANASQVIILPGSGSMLMVDAVGSVVTSPSATTTYTISAVNTTGAVEKSLIITVVGEPSRELSSDGTAALKLVLTESGSLVKNATTYSMYNTVCAGDNPANLASRAFLSFDLSSLPPQAVISEAILDLSGNTIIGNPSYVSSSWGNMGALEVYQYQYGNFDGLGRLAYEAIAPTLGSLRINELTSMPLKLDITTDSNGNNTIQQLLVNGQKKCQFRIQFFTSTNWDSKTDMICMETAVLRLKYHVP